MCRLRRGYQRGTGLARKTDLLIPRVTFTIREVAAVGARTGHTVRTHLNSDVGPAVAEAKTDGFSRLVLDRRGRVIGATAVGPRAGKALAELTLAIRTGLRARDLAVTMHPYPTYGGPPMERRDRRRPQPIGLWTAMHRRPDARRCATPMDLVAQRGRVYDGPGSTCEKAPPAGQVRSAPSRR